MVSLKNKKGFTIVELLIVIVVIGILATLVIVTFTGIQQKGRNTQRKTDINAITSYVEAFYAETGSYPTLDQLNNAAFRAAHMKGFKIDALADPKSPTNQALAAASTSESYGYVTVPSDCAVITAGEDPTTNCESYALTATLEDNKTSHDTYVKSSE